MKERLQKLISAAGVCSRRKAEELIRSGLVLVDGKTAQLGDQADPDTQTILVEGLPLPQVDRTVTLVLYKPRGYVTTLKDEQGRRDVSQLLPPGCPRLYPVGRLDQFSEGLLLMTNDGDLTNRLTHPGREVDKVYALWVSGFVPGKEQELARPITLDGYTIRPPKIRLLWRHGDTAKLLVTIHEGRNRQIRRMCQSAGLTVTRLRREREGPVCLGSLGPGQWRELTEEERRQLAAEA